MESVESFKDLPLEEELLKAIEELGFTEPSPIQSIAIPRLLEGRDVIGQAQTGTGKTAAFGLPLLQRIDAADRSVQALVLCPTRELALQVANGLTALAKHLRGVRILSVYGGQPIEPQASALRRGAQVVVGTPGRILDHINRGTLQLGVVRMTVLDEADEMLDMGFREDIERILSEMPEWVQSAFFSATMPDGILELARRFLREPELLRVTRRQLTVANTEQAWFEVRPFRRVDAVCRIFDAYIPRKAIVFRATKQGVDELAAALQQRGILADALHGDLNQTQRERVMSRFRAGGISVLVATDVAARGLDVDDVDTVINFDLPNDPETYVHRIGRTGRAGRTGQAFSFAAGRDVYKLRDIQRVTGSRIDRRAMPTAADASRARTGQLLEEVAAGLASAETSACLPVVEKLIAEGADPTQLAATLLRMIMQRDRIDLPGARQTDDIGTGRVRLFFNVGRRMRITPRDLVGAIAGETGISGRSIGSIEIHDRFSFVEVDASIAPEVVSVMHGNQIRGFRLAVEQASPREGQDRAA
ncbi:DEAD/DEAH box helicase [Nitratidesulfovibrio vulgaris]|uniref:DEAD-box ATP-dependent RNA helicase RhpA n=1 Tax=Nitratidesulfovibrio vulgaris (strain DP4) TaxID=391774 RepID=A0A0H3A487_NITV4|nr:DEAD/DEAH box helicase [Nitratidesulfovibrio vulgaris]ABM27103.1 DEAD/DEAH box helicase domain protein [Nitratidesulfovibrio vulgaris DP4]GEB78779.1 DEAD/DEAH box helicase [Desulfovibrio desulfuricans]